MSSTNNRALTIRENDAAMEPWGDIQQMKQIAARLKQMLPGGEKLTNGEALALAQAAMLLGRNPLVGEIWAIPGKGVTDGYRGLIKDAKPGNYHLRYRPLTAEEVKEHEVRPNDIAKACELYLFEEMQQCRKFGIPYEPTIGIGIVREEERYQTTKWDQGTRRRVKLPREEWTPIDPPTGRSWAWKAEIRAMKDALRRSGVQYVDREEIEALRQAAETLGVDTRGAETAEQILKLVAQHKHMQEERERFAQLTPEERAEQVKQDIDDLFGPEEEGGYPPPAESEIEDGEVREVQENQSEPEPEQGEVERQYPKSAKVKTPRWADAARKVVQMTGDYYLSNNGEPNYYHLTGAAVKCGYPEITDDNLADVMAALIDYANANRAMDAEESEDDAPF